MLTIQGRLIAPPEVKYISGRDGRTEVVERINIGKSVENTKLSMENFHFPIFDRWNIRNQFQKTRHIQNWACVMVSAQRPNQYQLSIAQQFVEHFPYVNFCPRDIRFSKRNFLLGH